MRENNPHRHHPNATNNPTPRHNLHTLHNPHPLRYNRGTRPNDQNEIAENANRKCVTYSDTDCNLYIFIKKQDDTKIEHLPQMTLIITNQFVKFVRFVGNKKNYVLLLFCLLKTKQNLLLTQRNAYIDELNPDGSRYSLLATNY